MYLKQQVNKLEEENRILRGIINNPISTTYEEGDIITWVWALPLATAKLGGVPRYRITITFIFTAFLSSILLVIS